MLWAHELVKIYLRQLLLLGLPYHLLTYSRKYRLALHEFQLNINGLGLSQSTCAINPHRNKSDYLSKQLRKTIIFKKVRRLQILSVRYSQAPQK